MLFFGGAVISALALLIAYISGRLSKTSEYEFVNVTILFLSVVLMVYAFLWTSIYFTGDPDKRGLQALTPGTVYTRIGEMAPYPGKSGSYVVFLAESRGSVRAYGGFIQNDLPLTFTIVQEKGEIRIVPMQEKQEASDSKG